MTEKKNKRIKLKGLLVAVACLAALLCGTLTANAATDGALFEGINLIVNGENVDLKDYIKNYKSYVDEDGNTVSEYEIEVPDESGEVSILVNEDSDDAADTTDTDNDTVKYEIHE